MHSNPRQFYEWTCELCHKTATVESTEPSNMSWPTNWGTLEAETRSEKADCSLNARATACDECLRNIALCVRSGTLARRVRD